MDSDDVRVTGEDLIPASTAPSSYISDDDDDCCIVDKVEFVPRTTPGVVPTQLWKRTDCPTLTQENSPIIILSDDDEEEQVCAQVENQERGTGDDVQSSDGVQQVQVDPNITYSEGPEASTSQDESGAFNLVISNVEGAKDIDFTPQDTPIMEIKEEPGSSLITHQSNDTTEDPTFSIKQEPEEEVGELSTQSKQHEAGEAGQGGADGELVPEPPFLTSTLEEALPEVEDVELPNAGVQEKDGDETQLFSDSEAETEPYAESALAGDISIQRLLLEPDDYEIDAKPLADIDKTFDEAEVEEEEDDDKSISSSGTEADASTLMGSPSKKTRGKDGKDIKRWKANNMQPLEPQLPLMPLVPRYVKEGNKKTRINDAMVACLAQCVCDKDPKYKGPHYHCSMCNKYSSVNGSMMMRHRVMKHQIIPYGVNVLQCCVCKHVVIHISEFIRHLELHWCAAYVFTEPVKRYLETELHFAKKYGFCLKRSIEQINDTIPAVENKKQSPIPKEKKTPPKKKANVNLPTPPKLVPPPSPIPKAGKTSGHLMPLDTPIAPLIKTLKLERAKWTGDKYCYVKVTEAGVIGEVKSMTISESHYVLSPEGYACKYCNDVQRFPSYFSRHLINAHKLEGACTTYRCDLCSEISYSDEKMIKHCSAADHVEKIQSILARNGQSPGDLTVDRPEVPQLPVEPCVQQLLEKPSQGVATDRVGDEESQPDPPPSAHSQDGLNLGLARQSIKREKMPKRQVIQKEGISSGTSLLPLTTPIDQLWNTKISMFKLNHKNSKTRTFFEISITPLGIKKVRRHVNANACHNIMTRMPDGRHKCNFCPRLSTSKFGCASHVYSVHKTAVPWNTYSCDLCGSRTVYPGNFVTHCNLQSHLRRMQDAIATSTSMPHLPSDMTSPEENHSDDGPTTNPVNEGEQCYLKPVPLTPTKRSPSTTSVVPKKKNQFHIRKSGGYTKRHCIPLDYPITEVLRSLEDEIDYDTQLGNSQYLLEITLFGVRKVVIDREPHCNDTILFSCLLCKYKTTIQYDFEEHCKLAGHMAEIEKAVQEAGGICSNERSQRLQQALHNKPRATNVSTSPQKASCKRKSEAAANGIPQLWMMNNAATRPGSIPLTTELEERFPEGDKVPVLRITKFGVLREGGNADHQVLICELCNEEFGERQALLSHCAEEKHLANRDAAVEEAKIIFASQFKRRKPSEEDVSESSSENLEPAPSTSADFRQLEQTSQGSIQKKRATWSRIDRDELAKHPIVTQAQRRGMRSGVAAGMQPLNSPIGPIFDGYKECVTLKITMYGISVHPLEANVGKKDRLTCELCLISTTSRDSFLVHCMGTDHYREAQKAGKASLSIYSRQTYLKGKGEILPYAQSPHFLQYCDNIDRLSVASILGQSRTKKLSIAPVLSQSPTKKLASKTNHPELCMTQGTATAKDCTPLNASLADIGYLLTEFKGIAPTLVFTEFGIKVDYTGSLFHHCELCSASLPEEQLIDHMKSADHKQRVTDAIVFAERIYQNQRAEMTRTKFLSSRMLTKKPDGRKTRFANLHQEKDVPLLTKVNRNKISSGVEANLISLASTVAEILSEEEGQTLLRITPFGTMVHSLESTEENVFSCELCSLTTADQFEFLEHCNLASHLGKVSDAVPRSMSLYFRQRSLVKRGVKIVFRDSPYYTAIAQSVEGTGPKIILKETSAYVKHCEKCIGKRYGRYNICNNEPELEKKWKDGKVCAVAIGLEPLFLGIRELLAKHEGHASIKVTPYGFYLRSVASEEARVFQCELCEIPATSSVHDFLKHCSETRHLIKVMQTIDKLLYALSRQLAAKKKGVHVQYLPYPQELDAGDGGPPAIGENTVEPKSPAGKSMDNEHVDDNDDHRDGSSSVDCEIIEISDDEEPEISKEKPSPTVNVVRPLNYSGMSEEKAELPEDGEKRRTRNSSRDSSATRERINSSSSEQSGQSSRYSTKSEDRTSRRSSTASSAHTRGTCPKLNSSKPKEETLSDTQTSNHETTTAKVSDIVPSCSAVSSIKEISHEKQQQSKAKTSNKAAFEKVENPSKTTSQAPKLTVAPNAPEIIEKVLPDRKKSYILKGYLPLETSFYEATETLRKQRPANEGKNIRYKVDVTSYGFVQNRIVMDEDVWDPVTPQTKQGMINCAHCEFTTITKQHWENHMAEKHPAVCKFIYQCKPCSYLCLKPSTFYRHGKNEDHLECITLAKQCARKVFLVQKATKSSSQTDSAVDGVGESEGKDSASDTGMRSSQKSTPKESKGQKRAMEQGCQEMADENKSSGSSAELETAGVSDDRSFAPRKKHARHQAQPQPKRAAQTANIPPNTARVDEEGMESPGKRKSKGVDKASTSKAEIAGPEDITSYRYAADSTSIEKAGRQRNDPDAEKRSDVERPADVPVAKRIKGTARKSTTSNVAKVLKMREIEQAKKRRMEEEEEEEKRRMELEQDSEKDDDEDEEEEGEDDDEEVDEDDDEEEEEEESEETGVGAVNSKVLLRELVSRKAVYPCGCGLIFSTIAGYYLHLGCHRKDNIKACNYCSFEANNWMEFHSHFFNHDV